MTITQLLTAHHALLQQARLAGLARAYVTLRRFAERVRCARLRGLVNLRQPDAAVGRLWATLTALEGSQSVLEEHFREEELMEFADAVAFVRGLVDLDLTFRLEEMSDEFVVPLEATLRRAGVTLDAAPEEPWVGGGDCPWPPALDWHEGEAPNQR
jgi:hypothetical protein